MNVKTIDVGKIRALAKAGWTLKDIAGDMRMEPEAVLRELRGASAQKAMVRVKYRIGKKYKQKTLNMELQKSEAETTEKLYEYLEDEKEPVIIRYKIMG